MRCRIERSAFAFYLVSLSGFTAPTELAPARDRLAGIMLAVIVMWFVFDQVWPVRTTTEMRRVVASVLKADMWWAMLRRSPEYLPIT